MGEAGSPPTKPPPSGDPRLRPSSFQTVPKRKGGKKEKRLVASTDGGTKVSDKRKKKKKASLLGSPRGGATGLTPEERLEC